MISVSITGLQTQNKKEKKVSDYKGLPICVYCVILLSDPKTNYTQYVNKLNCGVSL